MNPALEKINQLKEIGNSILKRAIGVTSQPVHQIQQDITNRFNQFKQTVQPLSTQLNQSRAIQSLKPMQFQPPQVNFQDIQQRFLQATTNKLDELKPRFQDFYNDLQVRGQRVNQQYVQPAKNYVQDLSTFAGFGQSPEGLRRRQAFTQQNPKLTDEQMMETAINFSPIGVTKVGVKVAQPILKSLAEEGKAILSKLPKEARLQHIIGYANELLRAGFSKPQIDKLGPQESAAILKKGITPLERFGSGNESMKFAQEMAGEVGRKITTGKNQPGILEGAKEAFENWVNTRRASQIEGAITKQSFKSFDNEGMQAIKDFQTGIDSSGKFKGVKDFFDSKYQQLQKEGIEFNYKDDYLPGLWKNTQKEVEEKLGKMLGLKPSFTMKSVIKDYEEGIAKGLTPKYNNISELAGWYEGRANKATADKNFFDFLVKKNFIVPADTAPIGWKTLSPDRFPKFSVKTPEGRYSGTYKAEPELANHINNYLDDVTGPLQVFQSLATRVKNLGLAGGIPGTAINYHGAVNLFRRDLLSSKNPITTFFRDAKWIVNTKSAENYVNANLKEATFFTKHGLTLSSEDWGSFVKEAPKNKLEKYEAFFEKHFGDPLFKRFLPAIKLDFAKKTFDDLVKVMPEKEAAKKASELSNNVFGGINLDVIGRNKQTQGFLRSIILAPDWAETTIKLGKGIVKGILHPKTPEYATYRTITRNMLLFYLAENVVNKVMSGHYMFENEGNANKFRIDTGSYEDNGKKRYLQSWGTAQDMVRIPFQLAMGLAQGNFGAIAEPLVNRFSMPLSATAHLLTNQDYLHRPIYNKDRYGKDIPATQQIGGIGNELMQGFGMPVQVRSFIDFVSGKSTFEESVANALEAPVRYSGGPTNKTDKKTFEMLKTSGSETGDIMDLLKQRREIKNAVKKNKQTDSGLVKEVKAAEGSALLEALSNQKATSEKNKLIKDVFSMGITDEAKIEEILQKNNLGTFKDAANYMIRSLGVENGERGDYLKTQLTGLDNETYKAKLEEFAKDKLLTFAVTDEWRDSGLITDDQKKGIDKLIRQTTNPSAGKGSGPKKLKIKRMPIRQLSVKGIKVKSIKAIKVPKISALKPLKVSALKVKTLKARKLNYEKMNRGKF